MPDTENKTCAQLQEELASLQAQFQQLTQECQRAEEALATSQQRFHSFMDNSPTVAFIKDADGRYVYLNKACEQLFGKTFAESQGKTDFDIWPEETARQVRENDHTVLSENKTTQNTEIAPQADGQHQWLSFKFPMTDEAGQPCVGGMAIDITQLYVLQNENSYLQEEIKTVHNFEEIIGSSPAMAKVLRQVEQVAGTDATVLIVGETGTGKELFARALHNLSQRHEKPLIKVNCAALPAGLIESEFFGHEKGAFTGAIARKIGRFELAHGGTVFLDEIGDLPLDLQVKLLRVLQEQEFERVGSSQTIRVDVRVITATNRDLHKAVEEGKFRADLYYRLNVFPISIPPLRERNGDIALLAQYFVNKHMHKLGKQIEQIAPTTLRKLSAYRWPGNVRELEHVVERAIIMSEGPVLSIEDSFLPSAPAADEAGQQTGPLSLEDVERQHILKTLKHTHWVVEGPKGAALILELHPNTLRGRMRKLGIRRDDYLHNHDIQ